MNAIRKTVQTTLFRSNSKLKDEGPIANPLDSDILLGRSKASWSHTGNRKFRAFVGLHLKRYMECTSRLEKTMVVNIVAESVQEAGGRFLKVGKDGHWYTVTQKEVREKVAHALRDAVCLRVKLSSTEVPVALKSDVKPSQRRVSNIVMERRRSSVLVLGATSHNNPSETSGGQPWAEALAEMQDFPTYMRSKSCSNLECEKELVTGVRPVMQPTIRMASLQEAPASQRSSLKNDNFDSGEFSLMSIATVNQDMFDNEVGAPGYATVASKKPNMFESIKSELSHDPNLNCMIKQVSDRIKMKVSKEFLATKNSSKPSNSGTSGPCAPGSKIELRPSLADVDISEEFSVMSISDFKKASIEGTNRRKELVPSARRFPLNGVEIKPKAGWENEISEEFSSRGFSTRSIGSVSVNSSSASGTDAEETFRLTDSRSSDDVPTRHQKASSMTFAINDYASATRNPYFTIIDVNEVAKVLQDEPLASADKADRNLSSTSLQMSDFLNVVDFSEESVHSAIQASTHPSVSLRGSGRKKLISLLSDVGEEEYYELDASKSSNFSANLQECNSLNEEWQNVRKKPSTETEASEASSVDTEIEWNLTLNALARSECFDQPAGAQ